MKGADDCFISAVAGEDGTTEKGPHCHPEGQRLKGLFRYSIYLQTFHVFFRSIKFFPILMSGEIYLWGFVICTLKPNNV